jgi:hypothetical protein
MVETPVFSFSQNLFCATAGEQQASISAHQSSKDFLFQGKRK